MSQNTELFQVAHFRKIKTMAGTIEVLKHNLRLKENLDEFVDKSKSHYNYYDGTTTLDDFSKKYNEMISNLSRKNRRTQAQLLNS